MKFLKCWKMYTNLHLYSSQICLFVSNFLMPASGRSTADHEHQTTKLHLKQLTNHLHDCSKTSSNTRAFHYYGLAKHGSTSLTLIRPNKISKTTTLYFHKSGRVR